MSRDLKEEFFRLDGAWPSFELRSIRRRDDYLRPFRVLRCKIDDQVDFQGPEASRSATEATVLIEVFGQHELVAATGRGPVHAVDNAMRKILENTFHSSATSSSRNSMCACYITGHYLKTTITSQPHWYGCSQFFPMGKTVGEQ